MRYTTEIVQYDNPNVGCYVDESAGSADDCNQRTIEFAEDYGFKPGNPSGCFDGAACDIRENLSEWLSEMGDSAVQFLNDQETRSFIHWQFEDNSLFLLPDVDTAREEVGFVSSKDQDYPDDDYQGEWLHVSDHGNATLYLMENGKNTEIWSVV